MDCICLTTPLNTERHRYSVVDLNNPVWVQYYNKQLWKMLQLRGILGINQMEKADIDSSNLFLWYTLGLIP